MYIDKREEGLVNEVLRKLSDLLEAYRLAKRDMDPKKKEDIDKEMEYIRTSLPKLAKMHHYQHYWLLYLYELAKYMAREDEALYFILLLGGALAREGHGYHIYRVSRNSPLDHSDTSLILLMAAERSRTGRYRAASHWRDAAFCLASSRACQALL